MILISYKIFFFILEKQILRLQSYSVITKTRLYVYEMVITNEMLIYYICIVGPVKFVTTLTLLKIVINATFLSISLNRTVLVPSTK